jgi:hypothetical protein
VIYAPALWMAGLLGGVAGRFGTFREVIHRFLPPQSGTVGPPAEGRRRKDLRAERNDHVPTGKSHRFGQDSRIPALVVRLAADYPDGCVEQIEDAKTLDDLLALYS